MKKISILLPMILVFFGCVESELIIPGENVGGGNVGDENPTPTSLLQTYDYQSPFSSYQFNYNSDGDLSQASLSNIINGQSTMNGFSVTWIDALISQISTTPQGTFSASSDFTYNDSGELVEINAGTTPETKLLIEHDAASITATRIVDGVEENTFNFTKDTYGYINSMEVTDATSGDQVQVMFNMNANLISSNEVIVNGATVNSYTYTYDNKVNPLFSQTIDAFNALVLHNAFEMDATSMKFNLDNFAMLRSANNITSMVIENAEHNATIEYEYTYNENNLPTTATASIEGETEPSTITFTYY
ncbi:hypothetical protein NLM59_11045 [Weeksellaceae bacterium KMM 9724]|uniref:hypothetical protein n=1 Tax=Profundicola chukchiensis TaxID=2961959 RepID=UPI002437CC72|nr:hypothetical protein [Profundicola chukchiensis]MDG4951458.1 hypothetical protein [Profundicola chukchiensis]